VDLIAFRFMRQGFVYYGGKPVPKTHHPRDLNFAVESARRPYVLTLAEHLPALEEAYPGRFRAVLEQPRFLEPGTVVILRPNEAASRAASRSPADLKR